MLKDNDSLYSELLRDAVAYTMFDKRLRSMLLHVFKSLKGMNTKCLSDMYSVTQLRYFMGQFVEFTQPQRKTNRIGGPNCGITMLYDVMGCGMRTFSHLNALLMAQILIASHMTICNIHEI